MGPHCLVQFFAAFFQKPRVPKPPHAVGGVGTIFLPLRHAKNRFELRLTPYMPARIALG